MDHASGKRIRRIRPYPPRTLEETLSVARAIQQYNSGIPFDRRLLASAIGSTEHSSSFTQKLNSSSIYGLTQGGYRDEKIAITPRGEACITPKTEEERRTALLEAAMAPDVFRKFYEMLHGKPIPQDEYAHNLLQRELGVSSNLTSECFDIIRDNGIFADILQPTGTGSLKVSLDKSRSNRTDIKLLPQPPGSPTPLPSVPPNVPQIQSSGIFVAGTKHDNMANDVKNLLDSFGVHYQSADFQPSHGPLIPVEISARMKLCNAGILFVGPNDDIGSQVTDSSILLTQLLGAASVLYGDNVIVICSTDTNPLRMEYPNIETIAYNPIYPAKTALELLLVLRTLELIDIVPKTKNPPLIF